MGVGGEPTACICSATRDSCSLLTEEWAVALANAAHPLALACTLGKVEILCFEELDGEEESVIKIIWQVFHHGYGTSFKACWETSPPIWVRVMERMCIQNCFAPSRNSSGQKVCSGEVCAVCSKSRNALSVFSKVKLEVWWSEKNSSNDWLLVTAKQTSLLWRNKLGNNPKKFPEKPSLLNIPKRMKGWGNQVKLTYSGKVFEGKSCYFAGKAIKVLDFDFMHVKH